MKTKIEMLDESLENIHSSKDWLSTYYDEIGKKFPKLYKKLYKEITLLIESRIEKENS